MPVITIKPTLELGSAQVGVPVGLGGGPFA
jgi:hypothetical protein